MALVNKEIKIAPAQEQKTGGIDIANVLLWLLLFMIPLSLFMVLIAGNDVVLKYSQRIFYYHLPCNIACFAAFLVYFIGAIAYWRTRKQYWDVVMMAGLELGMLFALIGTLTGSVWARYAWGTFWTWDPRLTTVTIMMVVYVSGLLLRSAIEDPSRKAALTAVFGIIGFVNVPLVYFSTRWFPKGLHPVIFGNDGNATGLEGGFMTSTLIVCFIAIGLLFAYLLIQRVRLGLMQNQVEAMRRDFVTEEE
jgi:heme exporter protein C